MRLLLLVIACLGCGPETPPAAQLVDGGGVPFTEPGAVACRIVNERMYCFYLAAPGPEPEP